MDNQKTIRGQRNSNLELYRIIVMIMIVAHHFVVNSGVLDLMYEEPFSINSIFLFLLGAWGKTGINCFTMITGYFMCCSNITLKKYIKLVSEVLFYNICISTIFLIAGLATVKDIVNALLLVRELNSSNYIACFLVFYFLIPFLNMLLKNLNNKMHKMLICILLFEYVVCGTIPKFSVELNYVSWFIVLYLVAAYIRLYPIKNRKWGMLTLVLVLSAIVSVLVCVFIGTEYNKQMAYIFVSDSNTFFAFAIGVSSFMVFKNLKIKPNKWINIIAGSTFGVLCIHANSWPMRNWLWGICINVKKLFNFGFVTLVLCSLVSLLSIFIACTLIDIIRINTVEKIYMNLILKSKWYLKLDSFFRSDDGGKNE